MFARTARHLARAPSIARPLHTPSIGLAFSRRPPIPAPLRYPELSPLSRLAHTYARFPGDPDAEHAHPDPNRPPYAASAPSPASSGTRRRVVLSRAAPRASFETPPQATTRADGGAHPWWLCQPVDSANPWRDFSGERRAYLAHLPRREKRRLRETGSAVERGKLRIACWIENVKRLFYVWAATTLLYFVVGWQPALFWAQEHYPERVRWVLRTVWAGDARNRRRVAEALDALTRSVPEGERRTRFKLKLHADFEAACERVERRGISRDEWARLKELKLGVRDVLSGRFEEELERIAGAGPQDPQDARLAPV